MEAAQASAQALALVAVEAAQASAQALALVAVEAAQASAQALALVAVEEAQALALVAEATILLHIARPANRKNPSQDCKHPRHTSSIRSNPSHRCPHASDDHPT